MTKKPADYALWQAYKRRVTPLRPQIETEESPQTLQKKLSSSTALNQPTLPPARKKTLGLQKLQYPKRVKAQATLDLHGMTREEASIALLHFLRKSQAMDLKNVLVITGKSTKKHLVGKGHETLSGALLQWLQQPTFKTLVSGYTQAPRNLGGSGAYLLQLRKTKP